MEKKGPFSFSKSPCSWEHPWNLLSLNAAESCPLSQNHSGLIRFNQWPCSPQVPDKTARHKKQVFPLKTVCADAAATRQSEAMATASASILQTASSWKRYERHPSSLLCPQVSALINTSDVQSSKRGSVWRALLGSNLLTQVFCALEKTLLQGTAGWSSAICADVQYIFGTYIICLKTSVT